VSSRFRRAAAIHTLGGVSTLSPELLGDAARRLGALSLVVAAVAAIFGSIDLALGAPSVMRPELRLLMIAIAVGQSLLLWAGIASGKLSARAALGLAPHYQISQGLLSAVGFHAMAAAPGIAVRGWSPVAVWALAFPLIVPGTTRRVFVATLATAAMDPLGLWLNVLAGAAAPPPRELGQLFLPTVVGSVLAPIAAGIVYGLTVEVKRARAMGSYLLVEKLGQGGMGEVWRAEHRMLARQAAIKLIRPKALGAGDAAHALELTRRFEREAQATAALRSPHTIAVYDYGVAADGTFHYVMELLEGMSLQALVDRFGPLPPERVVHILRQACHSLAEAHAAGLVHRDIKPANLFVARLGLDIDFVKVLDFGLVKMQGPALRGHKEALTVAGAFTGTPAYMPPEVALGEEPIDGRADIYALGCVAYWLLTGHLLFEGTNAMQMVIDHVRTPATPPSWRARQPVPAELEELVLRCLAKDPRQRPQSAAEVVLALDAQRLEKPWTEARARDWWHEHAGTRAAPEDDPSGATLSFERVA
jgi:serine/threonine-protein kinase